MSSDSRMNWDTNNAFQSTVGRTVTRVEYGVGPRPKRGANDTHQFEYVRFHFSDGSMLDVSTCSNAADVAEEYFGLKASAFSAGLLATLHRDGASAPPPR
jgi:hypothetical protein